MSSPAYQIATALMSYGWVSKSYVWESNRCYLIRTSYLVIRMRYHDVEVVTAMVIRGRLSQYIEARLPEKNSYYKDKVVLFLNINPIPEKTVFILKQGTGGIWSIHDLECVHTSVLWSRFRFEVDGRQELITPWRKLQLSRRQIGPKTSATTIMTPPWIIHHMTHNTQPTYRITAVKINYVLERLWVVHSACSLVTRFMGPSWGPPGADRTNRSLENVIANLPLWLLKTLI